MRKSKFTEEQIALALRQGEAGTPVGEICRKLGITESTFFRWKKKFGGLEVPTGDRDAVDDLFRAVYDELRRIAHGQRRRWQGDETMNTTALVHEAYLKLVEQKEVDWHDRAHFYAVAATAMRQILINYAERRLAAKRGGGSPHIPLDEANPISEEGAEDLLALNEALERLGEIDPRQSRVVECRFFAGLGIRETAEALGVSHATIERDWALASAWLRRALDDSLEVPK